MSPGDRFMINVPEVSHETIDGEVVIINFENGNYYSLLGTAADIWPMVEGGAAVSEIIEAFGHRYTGDRNHMEATIISFIEELCAEELVVRENGRTLEGAPGPHPAVEPNGKDSRPTFQAPVLNKYSDVYSDVQDLLVLDPIHEVAK